MKLLPGLVALLSIGNCWAQADTSLRSMAASAIDTSSTVVFFFEDFNNNKNNWTVADSRYGHARIDSGFYFLTATGHAYGEGLEVKIDSRKDFEIKTRIKIISGSAEHKNYYSMLFWGREGMNSDYFTFAKDGFVSVERCNGKNQRSCIINSGSLQKTLLNPDDFNVYKIQKKGNRYMFFVNDEQVYSMPFVPFFGKLIGFGAGRKVTLAIDYLAVIYL